MEHIKTILQRIELDIKSKQQASRDAESVKRLRKEIEKVVRAPEHDTSFPSLIRTAYQGNNGKGIYRSTRKGKGIDIYDALYLLNNLRNEIAHPRNNKRMIYGITYASMFVEIWEKIRQDD